MNPFIVLNVPKNEPVRKLNGIKNRYYDNMIICLNNINLNRIIRKL